MWKTGRAASSSALICRLGLCVYRMRAQNVGAPRARRRRTPSVTQPEPAVVGHRPGSKTHSHWIARAQTHTTHTASGLGFVQYLIIACR